LFQYVSSLAGGKYYVAAILFEPSLFNPQHPSDRHPLPFFSTIEIEALDFTLATMAAVPKNQLPCIKAEPYGTESGVMTRY